MITRCYIKKANLEKIFIQTLVKHKLSTKYNALITKYNGLKIQITKTAQINHTSDILVEIMSSSTLVIHETSFNSSHQE